MHAFNLLCHALRALGFKTRHRTALFRLLAAILHLGNIEFAADPRNKNASASVRTPEPLETAALLLGIAAPGLSSLLTSRTAHRLRSDGTPTGDRYTDFLGPTDAAAARDVLATTLYKAVFHHIVNEANKALAVPPETSTASIAVLNLGHDSPSTANGLSTRRSRSVCASLARNTTSDSVQRLALRVGDACAATNILGRRQGAQALRDAPTSHSVIPDTGAQLIAALEREAGNDFDAGPAPIFTLRILEALRALCPSLKSVSQAPLSPTVSSADAPGSIDADINSRRSMKCEASESEAALLLLANVPHSLGTVSYQLASFFPLPAASIGTSTIAAFAVAKKGAGPINPLLPVIFGDALVHQINAAVSHLICPAPLVGPRSLRSDALYDPLLMVEATCELHPDHTQPLPVPKRSAQKHIVGSASILKYYKDSAASLLAALENRRFWNIHILPALSSIKSDEFAATGLDHVFKQSSSRDSQPVLLCCSEANLALLYPTSSSRPPVDATAETAPHFDYTEIGGKRVSAPDGQRTIVLLEEKEWLLAEASTASCAPLATVPPLLLAKIYDSATTLPPLDPSDALDQDEKFGLIAAAPPEHVSKVPRDKPKLSRVRRRWLCYTWCLTWWIPTWCLNRCGRMSRSDVRLTWREKVALCISIAMLSALMLFFITGFGKILCPEIRIFTDKDMAVSAADPRKPWNQYIVHGDIYDFTGYQHPVGGGFNINSMVKLRGMDISALFPRWDPTSGQYPSSCKMPAANASRPAQKSQCLHPALNGTSGYCHAYSKLVSDTRYGLIKGAKVGWRAWPPDAVALHTTSDSLFVRIGERVYDVTQLVSSPQTPLSAPEVELLKAHAGTDIAQYKSFVNVACLDEVAHIGQIDTRNTVACKAGTYVLFGVTYIMVAVVVVKFLAAIRLGSRRKPEGIDKYVIMQVPCYSEGTDSLKKTIDSLALTDYDDRRKLLFVVADGMVKGAGNEFSTPDLVLNLFGVPSTTRDACEACSYIAIGEGSKQHNRAKVYSGLYHVQGRAVPYMVVVKCGTDKETTKAGNRGKRDSQMILMKFVNKVFFDAPLAPLELEMYRHMRSVIGVAPASYEYVLMVDADTEVGGECLTRLISCCLHDSKIMGLCGETRIANERESWITMIQVYEYYISHHLAKAFESLFGSVTCLPGCFCMYRLYSQPEGAPASGSDASDATKKTSKRAPLVVAPEIIRDYSECNVDTLHKKNLLSLGEDRYLTTLLLKYFPQYKMKFMPDSFCLTIVPTSFSVLLSQRRRWINSTIHNLFELLAVDDLCGCMIFSMRLIVFLDLFATLVMPASVAYLMYLIYAIISDPSDERTQVLILIGITYGLQALIFLMHRQWQHIGWMLIHILAMPVFYMWIPLYSFWHFDDFSWGTTRRIEGADSKAGHAADTESFDPNSIPLVSWAEFKANSKRKKGEKTESVAATALLSASSASHASPSLASTPSDSTYSLSAFLATPAQSSASPLTAEAGLPTGPLPSDAAIRAHILKVLADADLQTTTKRSVRSVVSTHFGVNLASKRALINATVDEFVAGAAKDSAR